jgi:TRAP-type C4-dicarboxylate transport system permease small subunit
MKGMKILRALDKHFEESIAVCCLIVMVLIMGMQVFSRYVLNASLVWSEEITRYLFIWCGFMSIGLCIRHGLALRVDQLLHMVPPKITSALNMFSTVVELALFVFLLPHAYTFVSITFASGRLSPAALIPIWIVQAAPVTGFTFAVIRCVQRIVLIILEGQKK